MPGFATGWRSTIYGAGGEDHVPLSQILRTTTDDLQVRRVEAYGSDCIEISLYEDSGKILSERWYIDPKRGYALVGRKWFRPTGNLWGEEIVGPLEEVTAGVFFPRSSVRTIFDDAGIAVKRLRCHVDRVEANASTFDASVFQLKFPAGTVVLDELTRVKFTVSKSDADLLADIESAVSMAKEHAVEQTPAVAGAAAAKQVDRPGAARPEVVAQTGQATTSWAPVLMGAAGALCLVALISVVAWRYRRGRAAMLVLGLVVIRGISPAQGEIPSIALKELDGAKTTNCALNCTAFVLRYYEKPASLEELTENLGIGENRGEPARLDAVVACLKEAGLEAEAYKDATFDEMCGLLEDGTLVLVHTRNAATGMGHIAVWAPCGPGEVFVVDLGRTVAEAAIEDLRGRVSNELTGVCVRIRRRSPRAAYRLSEGPIAVDVGRITMGQGELKIPIRVVNDLGKVIAVSGWKGSCDCVAKVALADDRSSLGVGETGTLVFEMERSAIGGGRLERRVLVFWDSERQTYSEVRLVGHVMLPRERRPVAWVPEKINARELEGQDRSVIIRVCLPKGVSVIAAESSVSGLWVEKAPDEGSSTLVEGGGVVCWRVRGAVSASGTEGEIRLKTTSTDVPVVRIPVVGEP
jgi:hypothetical protein